MKPIRFLRAQLLICACLAGTLLSQGTTPPTHATTIRVPFVGCKSDGQLGPIKAPANPGVPILVSVPAAQKLAYYKPRYGLGVLAPRGWHCFSTYGSNGSNLYVSPNAIKRAALFSTDWKGFTGQVIQVSVSYGGTSGRFEVAKTIARVFPDREDFVRQVIAEGNEPSHYPFGPYSSDKLTYRDKSIVEYETPANTQGLGTDSNLQSNSSPIRGVAILSGKEPDLVQLSIRLSRDDHGLTQAIIRQVESEAATSAPSDSQ
jgi:hypothetical protein